MSEIAVALVLCAAVLHATWNAIVKGTRARALVLAAVAATNATVGLGLLLWAETPAVASWPYIAASSIIHYGYYYFRVERRSGRLGPRARMVRMEMPPEMVMTPIQP